MNLFNQFDEGKPYNGFKNLEHGTYEVVLFRFVRNKFFNPDIEGSLRRILVAELSDQILFLPSYMAVNFRDDDALLAGVNNDGVKKFLCFHGEREDG